MSSEITFAYRNSNGGEEIPYEIVAYVGGESFPVVRFYGKSDLYRKGLEKNHKPLVSVIELARGISELLEAWHKLAMLDEKHYNTVMEAYSAFIDKHITYSHFAGKVSSASDNGGWV